MGWYVVFIYITLIFLFGIFGTLIPIYIKKNENYQINNKFVGSKKSSPIFKKCLKFFSLDRLQSLASGAFLAIALAHLIPDAIVNMKNSHLVTGNNFYIVIPLVIVGSVFTLFLALEHSALWFKHKNNHNVNVKIFFIGWFSLFIHSIFAGIALGITTAGKTPSLHAASIGLMFAILLHKFWVTLSITTELLKDKNINKYSLLLGVIFSIATPLGIIIGNIAGKSNGINSFSLGVFISIAAGVLLWLGTLHGLGESILLKKCCNFDNFIFTVIGFAVLAGVGLFT